VLATLEYLAVSGLKPTVSTMSCAQPPLIRGPGALQESAGDAFDISAVNGIKIAGHHGPGSITDTTVRKLLTLQGSMKPHQIISPIHYPGTDNTRASAAHPDRVHVAFEPLVAVSGRGGGAFSASVSPSQWIQLIARLGEIPNPRVERGLSAASIPDHPSAPPASEREPGGHH